MLGELDERAISIEEVREAGNEMKSGKASGLDGSHFTLECLQKGCMAVLEWLVKLERRFWCGGCIHGLMWCLYSATVQRGG